MTDSEKLNYLIAAVDELLRRVGGVAPQRPAADTAEYWPSAIPGQRIPKVTGDLSIDFAAAAVGMHNAKPTPDRDANLAQWQEQFDLERFTGPFQAAALSVNDAAYLRSRVYDYTMHTGRNLFYDICSGGHAEISQAIARGDTANPGMGPWAPDNSALPAEVERLFEAHKRPS